MRRVLLILLLLSLGWSAAVAREWPVGPGRSYTAPSSVAALVQNGDTVSIDAGSYASDVCRWSASHLVIRGNGGLAELHSGGAVYGGKAIWVIAGDSCLVSNIAFYDATCPDANGAGIRLEGHSLDVFHCVFTHNQDGILCGALHPSTVRIRYSEFNANGAGDGYSHNLYIGNVDSLFFEFNYSHGAKVGHELKSRANINIIRYNRISNEEDGTASRNIDLPNGGTAILIGNEIEQGPHTQNSNMMEFGLEGLSNPGPQRLILCHNTLVNDLGKGSFVSVAQGTDSLIAFNNLVAGNGTWLSAPGSTTVFERGNSQHTVIQDWSFVDAATYNYHLFQGSIAVDSAYADIPASFNPRYEYQHPQQGVVRCYDMKPDRGAHEYCFNDAVANDTVSSCFIAPNPASDFIRLSHSVQHMDVYSAEGRHVLSSGNCTELDVHRLPPGVYRLDTDGHAFPFVKIP